MLKQDDVVWSAKVAFHLCSIVFIAHRYRSASYISATTRDSVQVSTTVCDIVPRRKSCLRPAVEQRVSESAIPVVEPKASCNAMQISFYSVYNLITSALSIPYSNPVS